MLSDTCSALWWDVQCIAQQGIQPATKSACSICVQHEPNIHALWCLDAACQGAIAVALCFANDRSILVRQDLCHIHLSFAKMCNDCLLDHHKSKLRAYAAGSLAWCAASAPSSLHVATAERFALEQQAETSMCSMSQPEHGQQVCSGRSGHGACLV